MLEEDQELDHHHDTGRIEAFSDGVIAIAITLLVLDVAVPHVEGNASLGRALLDEWPSFVDFVISFVTVGIMWMNHHAMFKDIERSNHILEGLNLLLLLSIASVPFSTAVLAEYLEVGGDSRVVATMFYGGTFAATACCFNALWFYAARGRRLIDRHVSNARVHTRTVRFIPGPLLYGIGIPLALVSPWLTLAIYAAMAGVYLLPFDEM